MNSANPAPGVQIGYALGLSHTTFITEKVILKRTAPQKWGKLFFGFQLRTVKYQLSYFIKYVLRAYGFIFLVVSVFFFFFFFFFFQS